jgi:signal transduction histidine kinase
MSAQRPEVADADSGGRGDKPRSADVESLCNLASGIAHELRNPLNTVSLAFQFLQSLLEQRGLDVGIDIEEHFRKIHFELGKMRKILDNFTRFRPVDDLRLERTELRWVVDRALAETAGDCRKAGIEVRDEVPAGLEVLGDPDILAEAIVHLVDNAVDAMPEGGVLSLAGEVGEGCHRLRVADTGPGLPSGSEGRIFEPYFTTRSGRLGVGLTLASGIVKAHGGRIEIGRGKDAGTEISVEIPCFRP